MTRSIRSLSALVAVAFSVFGVASATARTPAETATKPGVGFVDLMQFHTVPTAVIADDGSWIAFEATPDRGDGYVELRSTDGARVHTVERGSQPALTPDGRWAAAKVLPSFAEREKADSGGAGDDEEGGEDDEPTDGLALVDTRDGVTTTWERVSAFAFSGDGRWLAVHHLAPPEPEDESEGDESESESESSEQGAAEESEPTAEVESTEEGEAESAEATEDDEAERVGTVLRLRRLADGFEIELADVEHFAFDATGAHIAVAHARADSDNRLVVHDLAAADDPPPAIEVTAADRARYTALTWTSDEAESPALAFVAAVDDGDDAEPGDGTLWLWDAAERAGAVAVGADWPSDPGPDTDASTDATAGWRIPSKNALSFSRDGERLFFGTAPRPEDDEDESEAATDGDEAGEGEDEDEQPVDPLDTEAILSDATVDVWHTADPLIKTNERKQWEEVEKDRTYLAVHHRDSGRTVQLGDRLVREIRLDADSAVAALGAADVPYLRERTWDGFYADLYRVDLRDGSRTQLAVRLADASAALSPDGRFVVYWHDHHWHLYDATTGATRNLTEALPVGFADELHDYPAPVPGYERPVWLGDSSAVVLHDRFDLWRVPADRTAPATRLTAGRDEQTVFRVVDLDPDAPHVEPGSTLLVEGYSDVEKNDGFWQLDLSTGDIRKLVEEAKRFEVLAKAEDADRILYTRESYREFPDLWVATAAMADRRELTDVNPQITDFAWGHAELVDFTTNDGVSLQGVLIRPESLTDAAIADGERCPVLVYYYRYFSQRLHQFNEPVVNHRPSFPLYAGDGYCVFLPDVVFDIGRPGHSATQSVVAGVQELVRRGIADPERLGLHGHSWSGYQTAHVVTQTDIFAAAVAGAPVTNMTSAYGGIRYGTGLARQFQYEKTQSRLGASLWEGRDRYIENSPLFYADRIETPLLMMFGDEDGAVPWTQGIELYLALRRLDRRAVLLQYRGEGHHLRNYGNKLDYAIKMKEFFDHYLKDAPAPTWWSDGVPYRGDD